MPAEAFAFPVTKLSKQMTLELPGVSTILSNAQQKKGLSKVGYLAYTSNPIFALVLEVQLYHLHLKRFLFEFHLVLSCYANSGYFLSLASCFGDG